MDQQPKKKVKGIPDIVMCLDVTGPMGTCLEQLKTHLGEFIAALEAPIDINADVVGQVVDWRIRLLPFRDLQEDEAGGPHPAICDDLPFCTAVAEFREQLADSRCVAAGGGDEPESSLDALYRAANKTLWRAEDEAHRFVILFTDATPRETLHPTTAEGGPNDISEVQQALKSKRIKPILFAPKASAFEAVYKAVDLDHPELAASFPLFDSREDALAFFSMTTPTAKEHFAKILDNLGKTISMSSSEEL